MTKMYLRALRIGLLATLYFGAAQTLVTASTPAETLIAGNIQTGLGILSDKKLTDADRKAQFQAFLLGVTDMRRIALFTLGPYAAKVSDADKDAFAAAFQAYAITVYQSYLSRYAGQTLTVVRSSERAPGDDIVVTRFVDPANTAQVPLEVDFRVRNQDGKPQIVDFSVAGIWLALAERDDFGSVLAQNKGDVPALTARLKTMAERN